MTRKKAEKQMHRTTTVGQLVAALRECRDQTDVSHVFEHYQGGTRGFEIACQRLGISKSDWDYAIKEAGFYGLVGIVGEKLGLPRYDPAADKARREMLIGRIKSRRPVNENRRSYAGIGSRQTPAHVLAAITEVAKVLAERGYILRSGGAEGADAAFENGAGKAKEIFLPWRGFNQNDSQLYEPSQRATELAESYHPAWLSLSEAVRKLMARNTHQILGQDCNTPVDFVVCYTKAGAGKGGTGQALRIAEDHQIPVIDLGFFEQGSPAQIIAQTLGAVQRAISVGQEIRNAEWETKMRNEQTPYKFVGDKIITYYAAGGRYCLVAYDTINKRASEPLATTTNREEIERLVAKYDSGKKTVRRSATRKINEMFVSGAHRDPRASHGPDVERQR
jgi:hypothetical protein